MKRILIIFYIFAGISLLLSQTYYLDVNLKSGEIKRYKLTEIKKIDFNEIIDQAEIKKLDQIVKTFKLLQNYPNPFNPSTTIQYELPRNGRVKICVFDINGRLVKTLIDKNQKAGPYSIVWDGKNEQGIQAATGLYIYNVNFEQDVFSKKMILIK